MDDWQPVELSTTEEELIHDIQPETVGLEASPQILHEDFKASASHLEEVRNNHTHVLVQAGMLPESHLAEVDPSRQLAWVIEELHGQINPDGLSIPMAGLTEKTLKVDTTESENGRLVRLTMSVGDEALVRVMPVPVNAGEVSATLVDGRLRLRW